MQILNNNTVSGLIRYRQINYVLNSHYIRVCASEHMYIDNNICTIYTKYITYTRPFCADFYCITLI